MFITSLIQSCIVFVFLTIFFFTYVSSIEREEFEVQLDLITDDIFIKYRDKIEHMFPDDPNKKDVLKTLIYGIIDHSEDLLEKKSKGETDEIDSRNSKIVKNSIYFVLGYIVICMCVMGIIWLSGNPLCIGENMKEGLFILFFVFLVEFAFLNLIASHYLSGNANRVLGTLTSTVITYIDNRKS